MRSITFNGVTRITPGAITKINAEALNQIGVSSANIVGLIGEADGGEPGSSSGLVSLRDPSRASALFRSGPLVDAIRLAFQSSGDPIVPGGAAEVVIYKVNESTQSSIQIPDPAGDLVEDTAAAGSTTTSVNLTTGGLTADELIGRWADFAINSLPVIAAKTVGTGSTTTRIVVAGLVADQYVGMMLQFGAATTTALLQNDYATIIANDGTALTVSKALDAAPVSGDVFDVLATFRRRITDNTTTALTVTPALPVAPAAADGVRVRPSLLQLTSRDFGAHTEGVDVDMVYDSDTGTYQVTVSFEGDEQVSESLGGDNFLQLFYHGGANAVATDTVLTPASTTNTTLDLTTGGLTPSAQAGKTVVVTNPATGNSEQVRITTNGAATLTLETPGLSDAFVTEIKAASVSTVLVDIKTVTSAVAVITGSSGAATTFATTVTGVTGDNLSLTISASETVQGLIDRINLNTSYTAVLADGINGSTSLAKNFDFGTRTEINIQKEVDLNGGLGFKQDLFSVVTWLTDIADKATGSRFTTDALDGSMLPRTEALMNSLFVNPFGLEGGDRGVSTNSDWQAAFDAMLLRRVDNVVPLIDEDLVNEGFGSTATWASVSQQLLDHVIRARGAAGLERGSFVGFKGTKSEYIDACLSLNDFDVQCVSQNPTVLDATGTLVEKGPREFAVMGASMRSGVAEIGEPLTHKYLRVSGLTQDSSWDPNDLTDAGDLIFAGAFFAQVIPGRGTRWVRDLTTWVKDDNLCFIEGSVRSAVRTVAFTLRTTLDDRFTGRKATPVTINNVKDVAVRVLEELRGQNIIVDSTDPTTGATVRAYHNLKVFTDGDVLRLNVGIFPVVGINFQLNEIFLSIPTQSA